MGVETGYVLCVPDSEYPQDRTAGDQLYSLARAGASAVPFVGGLLVEVIEQIWVPTLQKRQLEWLAGVAEELNRLAGEVSSVRDRLGSDEFIDLFLEAQRSAQRTHEAEKREALRNAVLNAALNTVEENHAWRMMFVRRLDELQVAHLQFLKFLNDPVRGLEDRSIDPPNITMGGKSLLVQQAFPEWSREFYDQLYRDLSQMNLVGGGGLHVTVSASSVFASDLTDQGRRFLAFISEPERLPVTPDASA